MKTSRRWIWVTAAFVLLVAAAFVPAPIAMFAVGHSEATQITAHVPPTVNTPARDAPTAEAFDDLPDLHGNEAKERADPIATF
jgi:hypothetical protein